MNHVHFYKDLKEYLGAQGTQSHIIRMDSLRVWIAGRYRHKDVISLPSLFVPILIFIFALIQSRVGVRLTLHLKKVKFSRFFWLKKPLKTLRLITDLEGDAISEAEYLSNFDNFNQKTISTLVLEEAALWIHFDKVFVQTKELRNLLIERHGSAISDKLEVAHILTSRTSCKVFSSFDRKRVRNLMGLNNRVVLVYIGNIYYPWQNFDKSIEFFKDDFMQKFGDQAYFVVATRKEDMELARKKLYSVNENSIVINLSNDEIPAVLSASDFGIVLRDCVKMNEVIYSGKFLEYLLCGLPVFTTEIMQNKISDTALSKAIINVHSSNVLGHHVPSSDQARTLISKRANDLLTIEKLAADYHKYNSNEVC